MSGTREIALTQGATTVVDTEDYQRLLDMGSWHLSSTGYAVRRSGGKTVRMHRVVNQTPEGLYTDHINRNKLDNRRINLRAVTHKENLQNIERGMGYWYHNQNKNWVVELRGVHIGCFESEELANQIATMIYDGELPAEKIKAVNHICKRGHDKRVEGLYGISCRACVKEDQKNYYKRKVSSDVTN